MELRGLDSPHGGGLGSRVSGATHMVRSVQKTLSACFLFFSFQLSRPLGHLTGDPLQQLHNIAGSKGARP